MEPKKLAVMGSDLGGSKLLTDVYPLTDDYIVSPHSIANFKIKTQKGRTGLQLTIRRAWEQAAEMATAHGYNIIAIGIGSPGRPTSAPKQGFIIAPTSGSNLEKRPGELDGKNLQVILRGGVPNSVPLHVNNDAVIQMQAILVRMLEGEADCELHHHKVAYIGPGTGLGGGFAKIDGKGNIHIRTDGHIYDIRLEMKGDISALRKISEALPDNFKLHFCSTGNTVRAEDVLSGSAFKKLTGVAGEDVKSAEEAKKWQAQLEIMGRGLAEMIAKIYKGKFEKLDEAANWSKKDLRSVKGTRIYVLGGGMTTNPHLMKIIEQTTLPILMAEGIAGVRLISVPKVQTTLAAANIVPREALRLGT